jgi:hydrogenase-4 component E
VDTLTDILTVLLVLLDFRLLWSGRLATCIQTVAAQALILAAVALTTNWPGIGWELGAIVAFTVAIKGVGLPWLLRRAVREASIAHEVEPLVGFGLSLLVGIVLLGLCFAMSAPLSAAGAAPANLARMLIPASLFTTVCGLFLIIARKKAVTQVIGYLVMENGISAFGLAFAVREPLLLAMAVLLDVLVAVLVMGIAIYHISRQFDHIDTDRLTALKD